MKMYTKKVGFVRFSHKFIFIHLHTNLAAHTTHFVAMLIALCCIKMMHISKLLGIKVRYHHPVNRVQSYGT